MWLPKPLKYLYVVSYMPPFPSSDIFGMTKPKIVKKIDNFSFILYNRDNL